MPVHGVNLLATDNEVSGISTDLLVIGAWQEGEGIRFETGKNVLTASHTKFLEEAAKQVGFTAKEGTTSRVSSPKKFSVDYVLLVGLGKESLEASPDINPADWRHEKLRRGAGVALRSAHDASTVTLVFPVDSEMAIEAVATGAVLGAYDYTEYRTQDENPRDTGRKGRVRKERKTCDITIVTEKTKTSAKSAKAAVARAESIASAVWRTRDLVNMPPRDLYPESFAQAMVKQAKNRKVKVTVFDEKYLTDNGFGGILGVGQGSQRGPRLVKLEYSPFRAKKHLALVGKGITFDSGGLSLKPANSMDTMKMDMAGAASVAQALFAIADLGLSLKVTAWLPLAENMPGGRAGRPGDVLTIYGGKTVEVTNTDAEGRLVLADALVAAQEDNPDMLIDVATLTGAQIIALGSRVCGVMGKHQARNDVILAAGTSGENMWPMPFPEEIRDQFESTVADLTNAGGREGGMLAAGIFLNEFIDSHTEWAHIDIAGPAFNEKAPWGYTPKAGTGASVRTLINVASAMTHNQ